MVMCSLFLVSIVEETLNTLPLSRVHKVEPLRFELHTSNLFDEQDHNLFLLCAHITATYLLFHYMEFYNLF